MPWFDEDEPQQGTPVRMLGNWTDTVLYREGQKPQRGFGGRVLFYEEKNAKPVLVEGQMVVYAFDETNRSPQDTKPTRRYVFPTEEMPNLMSKSDLGASYSFWLPWDDAGGPQADISLVCRFEPKGGPVVVSEQTRHRLPGTVFIGEAATQTPITKLPEGIPYRPAMETRDFKLPSPGTPSGTVLASGIQPISYERPLAPTGAGLPNASGATVNNMQSTNIAIPDSLRGGGVPWTIKGDNSPTQQPAAAQRKYRLKFPPNKCRQIIPR